LAPLALGEPEITLRPQNYAALGVPPASVNDAFHFVESGISGNRLAVWALKGRMMVPRTLCPDRWAVGKTLTYVSVLRGKRGG